VTNPTISFTYGDPAEGTVTFGGASSDVRPIISWDVNVSYTTFVFSAVVRIIADSMSEMDTQIELFDKLKHNSGNFTLVSGSTTLYEINETNKGFAYRARTDLSSTDDANDHKLRRTFTFQLVAERPADSAADDGGRRMANITAAIDTSSRHRIAISGLYTAITSSDAVAQFKAKADTFANAVLVTFETAPGVAMDFEKLSQNYNYDDEKALLSFDFVYQQRRVPESTGTPDVAAIKDQQISMARQAVYQIGLDSVIPVIAVDIQYQAAVDSTVTNYDALMTLYKTTIKPYLLEVAKDRFATASTQIILSDENVRIGFDASNIMCNMSVLLKNGGEFTDLIVFEKTIVYTMNMQKDVRQRWTGKLHNYTTFTPGPRIEATCVVREILLGPPSYRGRDTVFKKHQSPSNLDPATASDTNALQVPGIPPFTGWEGEAEELKWILVASQVEHTPRFAGRDPDNVALNTQMTESNYMTSWLWGVEVVDNVLRDATTNYEPTPRPPEQGSPPNTPAAAILGGGDFSGNMKMLGT
jgi:hypothetical protein